MGTKLSICINGRCYFRDHVFKSLFKDLLYQQQNKLRLLSFSHIMRRLLFIIITIGTHHMKISPFLLISSEYAEEHLNHREDPGRQQDVYTCPIMLHAKFVYPTPEVCLEQRVQTHGEHHRPEDLSDNYYFKKQRRKRKVQKNLCF